MHSVRGNRRRSRDVFEVEPDLENSQTFLNPIEQRRAQGNSSSNSEEEQDNGMDDGPAEEEKKEESKKSSWNLKNSL
jgi:hypothetical protein